MRNLEEEIAEILRTGMRPVIHLRPGMQVIPPKQPRRGRPRVRQPDRPCAHYADIRAGGGDDSTRRAVSSAGATSACG